MHAHVRTLRRTARVLHHDWDRLAGPQGFPALVRVSARAVPAAWGASALPAHSSLPSSIQKAAIQPPLAFNCTQLSGGPSAGMSCSF